MFVYDMEILLRKIEYIRYANNIKNYLLKRLKISVGRYIICLKSKRMPKYVHTDVYTISHLATQKVSVFTFTNSKFL